MGDAGPGRWTRPMPRIEAQYGQSRDHVLWLHDSPPHWTYDPERRAGDVVPEVLKVFLSELRPTQGENESPATSQGPKHRAPRRRWPWEPTGGTMRFAG